MITEEIKQEVAVLIADFLRSRGVIADGKTVAITFECATAPSVIVRENQSEDSDSRILARVLNGMVHHQVRMSHILNWHKVKLVDIKAWPSYLEATKFRNIGSKSVTELAKSLKREGVDCPWVEPFLAGVHEHSGMDHSISKGVITKLTKTDWVRMKRAVLTPAKQHSCTQELIIESLERRNNHPYQAYLIFPKSIQRSRWKSMINLINQRWHRSNLPFRIRFTASPTARDKFAGALQVVVLPQIEPK